MPLSPYFPHVVYSLALTSISINFVGRRKAIEDERARVAAQLSILDSIKQQLLSQKPLSMEALDRLKKLARVSGAPESEEAVLERERVAWGDVFSGKGPASRDAELSKWDLQDLEILRKEFLK